jgi:hypothetical protein
MKKTLVTLVTFFTVGIAVSFANNSTDVDPKIVSAFQKEFSFAQNVKWGLNGELVQVNFSLNDQGFVAWYNNQAELISTARNILYMQLPLSVIKTLEQDYADASISGIVEFSRDSETFYQVTAERKGKKFLLKATPSGNVTITKKSK